MQTGKKYHDRNQPVSVLTSVHKQKRQPLKTYIISMGLRKILLTSTLVCLGSHTPYELHGVVTVLDLKVLLEFKVMLLSLNGLFTGLSEKFLSFLFGYKLGGLVPGRRGGL